MRNPLENVNDALAIKKLSSSQVICLSFLIAILIGGTILALPISHGEGRYVEYLDAIFTATSALCVTGLAVVDTGSDFNRFGQTVIMLLIQMGGLGVITFGTVVALLSGRKIGFRERLNLQAQFNSLQTGGIIKLVRRILLLVSTVEILGALLLFPSFYAKEGALEGAYYALFHSVSAFNNAGFGLYSNNLVPFLSDPLVNFTIMGLIVLGGLGFFVEMDVLHHIRHRWFDVKHFDVKHNRRKHLTLHSKMALTATGFLIAIGTLVFLLFEWTNPNTLAPLSFSDKLLASLFQSITPRTAGFNTLDYGKMHPGTLLFTMLLMFIGGSPGSTAGGIKTVTFFVLIGSAWSISRGHGALTIFGRRLSLDTVVKSGSIALISVLVLGAIATILTFTDNQFDALRIGFEAVSAFGTVGLSTGITTDFSPIGEFLLIVLMYLGRLGPLTLAIALVEFTHTHKIEYPTEDIIIG